MNKIRVMSAGAVEGPVTELAPKFTQAKDCEVELDFNTVGALKQRFSGGEKTDVIILSFPAIEALEANTVAARVARIVDTMPPPRRADRPPPFSGSTVSKARSCWPARSTNPVSRR